MRTQFVSLVVCATLAGCAAGDWDQPIDSLDNPLIDGSRTMERPEIGSLGGCTGTLIRPNVVISASHCYNYSSRRSQGRYGTYYVQREGQQTQQFNIDLIEVYDRQLGADDISLLHLSSVVPENVATPTRIADRNAERGEEAVLWGYGCTERWGQSGGGVKRKYVYPFGTSDKLCPGDSGGPGTIGNDGPVFLINSGYWGDGTDIFGEPWQLKQQLENQLRTWEETYGSPVPRNEIQVTNSSGRDLWIRCNGDDSVTCSWWVNIQPGQTNWVAAPEGEVFLSNTEAGGGWDWFEATAPGAQVTVYDNPTNPFYEPGTEPDPDPAPDPGGDPAPDPGDDPAPDPGDDPAPDPGDDDPNNPGDDPAPDPGDQNDDPNDDPIADPAPEPGLTEDGAWVDDPDDGFAWADADPTPTTAPQAGCSTAPTSAAAPTWILCLLPGLALACRRRR